MAANPSGPRESPARALWRGARRWAIRRREEAGDRNLGIETMGPRRTLSATRDLRNKPYEPLPYAGLRRIGETLAPGPEDVIYDLGCGKGRVVCWFARRPVAKVVGVEYDPALADAARANLAALRGAQALVEIRTGDAVTEDYSRATVVMLYNPFGATLMREVLENLSRSLDDKPRRLRIVYASPAHEEVFKAFPRFRETERFSIPYDLGKMAVVIYDGL